MRAHILIVLFLACAAGQVSAESDDLAKKPTSVLIDDLALIDSPAPGLDGAAGYDGFIADSSSPKFHMGLVGTPPPAIPPQMKELVRRGASALPLLLEHLGDKRPTRFSVGAGNGNFEYMFKLYSMEYVPKNLSEFPRDAGKRIAEEEKTKPFEGIYSVKIGDVCYTLVGQIVNRFFNAVRYQPTAGLIVNSPIEMPELAQRVRKDWLGVDKEGLKTSLLADLHSPIAREDKSFVQSTLQRLRFYYPDTYNHLGGEDLRKREAFDAANTPKDVK